MNDRYAIPLRIEVLKITFNIMVATSSQILFYYLMATFIDFDEFTTRRQMALTNVFIHQPDSQHNYKIIIMTTQVGVGSDLRIMTRARSTHCRRRLHTFRQARQRQAKTIRGGNQRPWIHLLIFIFYLLLLKP